MRRKIAFLSILFGFTCSTLCILAEEEKGMGLLPLSAEEIEFVDKTWPKIIQMRVNKIGALRLQEFLARDSQTGVFEIPYVSSDDEEFITYVGQEAPLSSFYDEYFSALPPSVDNSKLPCCPPPGDQGSLGSCVGWAAGYYQGSHEIGLLNGINNKTSNGKVLSPKCIYNFLNGGNDSGLVILHAYNMLAQNGAISIKNCPYDKNFREWDVNEDHWIDAISNRLNPPKMIPIGDPGNLTTVKQILNNGHVLTFGTYPSMWVYTKVGDDSSNAFAGQKAISYMKGRTGGHHITIVGYNDDIWIDINGNGIVDPGEKGAFLVMNSWGTDWGNAGFIWISYDAFFTNSQVAGWSPTARMPIAAGFTNSNLISVTPIAANYSPKLVATFAISQTVRNQIGLSGGQASSNVQTPATTFLDYALDHKGGAYAFSGVTKSQPEVGHFALDMTNLIPKISTVANRYFLKIDDNLANNPTQLISYSIIDLVNKKKINCTQVPQTADKSLINPYIDYAFPGDVPESPPVISITSPLNGAILNGTVNVNANATSTAGIASVEFYTDSNLSLRDTTAPYLYAMDTKKLSNGTHQLKAIAYDTKGQSSTSTVSFTVNNAQAPSQVSATYAIDTSWPDGYQVTVTLKNSSSQPTKSWTCKFTLPTGQTISSLWNGVDSVSGRTHTVTNPTWSGGGIIPAGGSVTLGMIVQKPKNGANTLNNLSVTAK